MIADGARHFEDFDGLTYLNCAHMGPLPRVAAAAVAEAIALKSFPNRIPDESFFTYPNRARAAIAPLIGARPEEIFIGSGAAHGMGAAAVGFPWKAGDEVVVGATDFPSNIYIWTQAARRHDARAVLVKGRRHAVTTREIAEAVTSRTRAIVVSLVDFGSGEVMDLERLGALARERDLFLAVDATQAAGAMPIDVHATGAALLVASGYKWLLAPYGTAFAWISPRWLERITPVAVNWAAAEGAENFNALPRENWRWAAGARRFDGPETAAYIQVAGLIRSAEFLGEIGVGEIHAHITALLDRIERELPPPFRRRSGRAAVPGPILSLEAEDPGAARSAYARLREAGVRVSLRDDGIRVSPHIYNTEADVERFLRLLAGS